MEAPTLTTEDLRLTMVKRISDEDEVYVTLLIFPPGSGADYVEHDLPERGPRFYAHYTPEGTGVIFYAGPGQETWIEGRPLETIANKLRKIR